MFVPFHHFPINVFFQLEVIIPLCDIIYIFAHITAQLRVKVAPFLHREYSKKGGKPGVGIDKLIYSLFLNIL